MALSQLSTLSELTFKDKTFESVQTNLTTCLLGIIS